MREKPPLSLLIAALLGSPALAQASGTIQQLSTATATDQQETPAISGTQVVWTDVGGGSNFEIWLLDLASGLPAANITNTPPCSPTLDQNIPCGNEFLEDIDAGNVVWTHSATGMSGDIVVYNVATAAATTVAASTATLFFQTPTIRGRFLTWVRITNQLDIDLYDNLTGITQGVTSDPAVQANPRLGPDFVVYEDYNSGNADIMAWRISTSGPPTGIATGPAAQVTPDMDGNTIVYIENAGVTDQLMAYDITTGVTTQLTTVASNKTMPRISGNTIVWTDDRNGNLDIFSYDLSTRLEQPLVTGPGDQFLSDIDGNRVVYTSNQTSFEQIYLFTFSALPPPPLGCDPTRTDEVTSLKLDRRTLRPVFGDGSFSSVNGHSYFVCVDNGLPDGSERASSLLFTVDQQIVLGPDSFKPNSNPPAHVAAPLPLGLHKRPVTVHNFTASLFGPRVPSTVTVTIRVSK
jgi:beta propeller repeat protein